MPPRSIRLSLVLTAALLAAVPADAQNREHQQLYAEIAMLQEQVQRLQLVVNALNERVGSAEAALATQAESARIAVADQRVLIDNLNGTLAKFNERLNDNSVRVGQLSTEMSSLRQGMGQVQTLLNQILSWLAPPPGDQAVQPLEDGATPPAAEGDTASTTVPPETTPPPMDPAGPVVPSLTTSPAAYYEQGLSAYLSTDYETAIPAFEEYIDRFPEAENADDAHYFLGESLYQLGRYQDALQAYRALTTRYRTSEFAPDAYYKQGVCYEHLRQRTEARTVYERLRRDFPDSAAATRAEQRLEALDLIRDP